jgi:hypothetical protein
VKGKKFLKNILFFKLSHNSKYTGGLVFLVSGWRYITRRLRYITLRYCTLLYSTLCFNMLRYTYNARPITIHYACATLNYAYATLHYITLCYATLQLTLCYITLLYAALRCSTLLYAALRCSTLLYAALRCSTLLYAALRCSTYCTHLYATVRYCTLLCRCIFEKWWLRELTEKYSDFLITLIWVNFKMFNIDFNFMEQQFDNLIKLGQN